jgi:preprotein translocase subunit SecY
MFRTFLNAFKIPELKKKLLFTGLILVLYRIGACLPVPFVDASTLTQQMEMYSGSAFSLLNLFSGNSFTQSTLFALGVSPYITASIVVQLLTVAFPKLAGTGEEGKKRMQNITRYMSIGVALVTAIGYYMLVKNNGAIMDGHDTFFFAVIIVACYCAGASLVMWLGELINAHGIGNGISLILFANIISSVPSIINMLINTVVDEPLWGSIFVFFSVLLMLALIWLVIYISDSERRIPVMYAKKVVGRKMYGGQNTSLPIKLNMTGVMPIIFANAIVSIPSTIRMFVTPTKGTFWDKFFNAFTTESWVYAVLSLVLIIAFAYFYSAISFNPIEVASNMQKNGGSIPGIRPGRATSDFITKVVSRITFIGALYLAVIAVVPIVIQLIINIFTNDYSIAAFAFGGSSIIIVVGVILETAREIEAQMTMRHYKGFLD